MPGDPVQPLALRQFSLDIGQHGANGLIRRHPPIFPENAPVRIDENRGRVMISGPPDHHPVQPFREESLGLIQAGDAAINGDQKPGVFPPSS